MTLAVFFLRWENPTVRYWSAVTDVFELQIHLAKVQSWFVRVTGYSYFMVITVTPGLL
jgi:hypothetical protein